MKFNFGLICALFFLITTSVVASPMGNPPVLPLITNMAQLHQKTVKSPYYKGSLDFRVPVWNSLADKRGGYVSDIGLGELAGDLKIYNLFDPFTLTVAGEHTLNQRIGYQPENKLKVGLEVPLTSNVGLFSYWRRDFADDTDRVFVGARLNFKGGLDY